MGQIGLIGLLCRSPHVDCFKVVYELGRGVSGEGSFKVQIHFAHAEFRPFTSEFLPKFANGTAVALVVLPSDSLDSR
jgi:hypothetical protein